MANLYEIDYQLQMLEDYMVDPETGELLDEDSFNAKFDEIQMALNEKIVSTRTYKQTLNHLRQRKRTLHNVERLRKI